jgi:hypothetical protein
MKITKRQLRRIIKEERAKLSEQGGEALIGEQPSELENGMAMALQELFEDSVAAEAYQGTGPGWEEEISRAGMAYHQALIDSGALKMVMEMFNAIEEELHDGQHA